VGAEDHLPPSNREIATSTSGGPPAHPHNHKSPRPSRLPRSPITWHATRAGRDVVVREKPQPDHPARRGMPRGWSPSCAASATDAPDAVTAPALRPPSETGQGRRNGKRVGSLPLARPRRLRRAQRMTTRPATHSFDLTACTRCGQGGSVEKFTLITADASVGACRWPTDGSVEPSSSRWDMPKAERAGGSCASASREAAGPAGPFDPRFDHRAAGSPAC